MGTLTKPYTFASGGFAVASQVNSDFDTLYSWVNTNAVWADASTAFVATPSGPNADPISNNQFTRKSYVDNKFPNGGMIRAQGSGIVVTSGAFTLTWTAFPTSTDVVLCQYAQVGGSDLYAVITGSATVSSVTGKLFTSSGGVPANGTYGISFIAIGH